jgi:methylmalonyl-CoA mutase cobalamin-binding subunit
MASRQSMRPTADLVAEGRAAAPVGSLPVSAFCRQHDASSEAEYKRRQRDAGQVMYHMHVGLSTWEATEDALRTVHDALAAEGHRVDRFGLAFDRAMGVPEADRHLAMKETGPRIAADQWERLTQAVPIQPHTGDYMIGLPAGFDNTRRALAAGVTTIGNVSQYSAYDIVGGSDDIAVTEATVKALAALAAVRDLGGLAHSNLEDGTGTQAAHFGSYIGWAALELHVVETMIGARLAQCYGNTIRNPEHRAIVHFALDNLRGRDSIGSMVYGNTVDQRPGRRARNLAVTTAQVMCDIALQLRRPTGHAVNPVPLTEAERIPSPAEIVEVHLLARELEREVRKAPDLYDWERLEHLADDVTRYAVTFRNRALTAFADDGIDTADAAQVLLAMRRITMADLEERVDLAAPEHIAGLRPWKASEVRELGGRIAGPRLDGVRVVLAVLEVHDLVRDALAVALPRLGAEVVLLNSAVSIDGVARAATDEDADAIVLGTYNGNAIDLAERLTAHLDTAGWRGQIYMGGILNQDTGSDLPIDARPRLTELGVHCVDRIDNLATLLAASAATAG